MFGIFKHGLRYPFGLRLPATRWAWGCWLVVLCPLSLNAQPPTSDAAAPSYERSESASTQSTTAGDLEVSHDGEDAEVNASRAEDRFRFSFNGARWREVLEWLAEEGEMALQLGELPTGSFTYSDRENFTLSGAISRLNLFLIPEGFAAVRRGNLLTVIQLGDPRSLQQLDALAEVVPPGSLKERDANEVVKCFLPLGELPAAEVVAELQPLSLMVAPVVLPKSNQLMVTETASKLLSVVDVIKSLDQPVEEAQVRRFDLQHVTSETLMLVAGGHLGIPADESRGLDITITTDLSGKSLFAIGSLEKLNMLEQLIRVLDVAPEQQGQNEPSRLVAHQVSGNSVQVVYDVLQTLLAGEDLRLSIQESTGSVVAYAPDRIHRQIEETIAELEAPTIEFTVIDLNGVEPYFAVSLIEQMFQQNAVQGESRDRDDEEPAQQGPKVDADPGSGRLFVRGTAMEIRQIEELIQRVSGGVSSAGQTRLIPLSGPQRDSVLKAANEMWDDKTAIQILPPWDETEQVEVIERALHEEQPQATARTPRSSPFEENRHNDKELTGLVADSNCESADIIQSQVVPGGIMIQSENLSALDRFENQLRTLSQEASKTASPPVIYYLKYVTAAEAVNMLADLLDGGYSLSATPANSLINGGTAGLGGGYFGSLLYKRDGATTVTAGTATIVSDARLNRLIVQGTAEDIATIERYMKIIDKQSSITDVETSGQTHVIELLHTKAEEVAEVIRNAYPERILAPQQPGNGGNRRQARGQETNRRDESRRDDQDESRERENRAPRPEEKPTRGEQPKMSVAVHEASNSLVITAPDALFEEVQRLVNSVDQRSEQVVEVVVPGAGVDLDAIMQALSSEGASDDRRRDSRRRDNDSRRGRR